MHMVLETTSILPSGSTLYTTAVSLEMSDEPHLIPQLSETRIESGCSWLCKATSGRAQHYVLISVLFYHRLLHYC